jgi:uncharacterized membrane protein YozB (DUF420 family)
MTAEIVIIILKVAVIAVTLLLLASLTALATGRIKLHGRINIAFFALTMIALLGFEVIIRFLYPDMVQSYLRERDAISSLNTHLWFALPSAVLLLVMLPTGLRRLRSLHIAIGVLFLVLWTGTFVTGVFYLPHH